ncbi:hypothetical protein LIER_21835 [Lithospermum erythrorhizon]|uniref:Uncharacterized protein n=1 Tax=Lithospermum erythrorhizon TaxID=34254 RepID=A0AAV3QRU6_LITER
MGLSFTPRPAHFLREKAWEEGVLQRRLRNLTVEHITLQERYAASIRRTEAVRAELEGVQVERDSAQLERDALNKETESTAMPRLWRPI